MNDQPNVITDCVCYQIDRHGTVDDGFGNLWLRCKGDCRLQVVRPGKVQCDCDLMATAGGES